MVVVVEVRGGEQGDGSLVGRQYLERGTRTVRVLKHTTECDACVGGCDESRVTEKRIKSVGGGGTSTAELTFHIIFCKKQCKK